MRKSTYKAVHGTTKGFKKTRYNGWDWVPWNCPEPNCSWCNSHHSYAVGVYTANEMLEENGFHSYGSGITRKDVQKYCLKRTHSPNQYRFWLRKFL